MDLGLELGHSSPSPKKLRSWTTCWSQDLRPGEVGEVCVQPMVKVLLGFGIGVEEVTLP